MEPTVAELAEDAAAHVLPRPGFVGFARAIDMDAGVALMAASASDVTAYCASSRIRE